MKRQTRFLIAVMTVALALGLSGPDAHGSAQCLALGANAQQVGGECQIIGPITAPCPLTLTLPANEDLRITSAGSIKCNDQNPASSITITVDGDMVMESGSEITVENTAAAGGVDGGDITITVSGNFLMEGPPAGVTDPTANGCAAVAGACISSSDLALGGGKAGNVTITVGTTTPPSGTFTMQPGTGVLANSTAGSGGEIIITSGLTMHVDGLVRSFGGIGGTGAGQPKGGGPITLKSGCVLEITPEGVVSSEGENPGADLVHLEGCEVTINGLVQSIARLSGGHVVPAAGNRCNDDNVTAHPIGLANAYTACVEVWGQNITINSTGANNGEISADGVRAPNRAWIDLIALFNIVINNDTLGPYSVHANSATANNSNSFGGVIRFQAVQGTITSTGEAVQANAGGPGSDGGSVKLEANEDIDLNDSSIEARGPNGSNTRGGSISVISSQGSITGNASSELDAAGGGNGGVPGSVTLQACDANPSGTYAGTSTPAAVTSQVCTGPPVPHAAAQAALAALAPICAAPQCQGGACSKSGTKFNDLDGGGQPREAGEPGIANWQICAFDSGGQFLQCVLTDANGAYTFNTLACGQTYTFCEVLQAGWNQTFPNVLGGQVVSCVGLQGAPGPLGPIGYQELLPLGQDLTGNDFGNFRPTDEVCPEDQNAVLTRVVDTSGAAHSVPVHATVQAAYNAVAGPGETIGIFSNTIENVKLNGAKSLKITQCTTAQVTAADANQPVWDLTSTGTLTIIGPDAVGGTIGWRLGSGGHTVSGVRASGASQFGMLILSSNNTVSFNELDANGVGLRIEGSNNDVRGGTVRDSAGDGVQIGAAASTNVFRTANVLNNGGFGIVVDGSNNTVKDNNRVDNNDNGGIVVTGGSNLIKNNRAGSDVGKGNGTAAILAPGILVEGANNTLDANRVNANTGPGIHVKVLATGTKLKANLSNQTAQGGAKENGGPEYLLEVDADPAFGGNRADTVLVPSAKCATPPATGSCE